MAGAHGLGQAVPARATGRSAAMELPLRLPPPLGSNQELSRMPFDKLRDRGKRSGPETGH